jgi:hypothetical protein
LRLYPCSIIDGNQRTKNRLRNIHGFLLPPHPTSTAM